MNRIYFTIENKKHISDCMTYASIFVCNDYRNIDEHIHSITDLYIGMDIDEVITYTLNYKIIDYPLPIELYNYVTMIKTCIYESMDGNAITLFFIDFMNISDAIFFKLDEHNEKE